jgi:uncharacterized protein
MRKNRVAVALTITSVGTLLVAGVYAWLHHPWLFSTHYDLRVATAPLGEAGQKLAGVFSRDVTSAYRFIRIVPVQMADINQSATALLDGKVQLAVVRSDSDAAIQGRTIFILRKIALGILVPPKSSIEKVQDLRGKRIGLLSQTSMDDPFVTRFSEYYGIQRSDFVTVTMQDIGNSLKQGKIAVAVVLGAPIGGGPIADVFSTIRKTYKAAPTFIEIGESEAISTHFPAYEAMEIPQGILGSTPSEPPEAVNTIGFSIRLASRASLPDRFAGEITRLLVQAKRELISSVPAIAQMEAPDVDKGAVLPVHPGSQAYLNGEQVSLLDETLNLYWYTGMAIAVTAPLLGWILATVGRRRDKELRARLLRTLELARIAKTQDHEHAVRTDAELQDLLEWFFHLMVTGRLERDQFQCIERMISQVRATIDRKVHVASFKA